MVALVVDIVVEVLATEVGVVDGVVVVVVVRVVIFVVVGMVVVVVEVVVMYFFGRVTFSSIIRMVRGVGTVFTLVVYVLMTPLLLLVVPEFKAAFC